MLIHEHPIQWYIDKMIHGETFCFPGYSDAEFFSMMGIRLNNLTGLGQVIHYATGQKLLDVMQRRQASKDWLFAIPKCLWDLPQLTPPATTIDTYLKKHKVKIEGYERDMVLDDLARDAGLFPLIQQLQDMDTVVIGNQWLSGLKFLDSKQFIPIPSPNLHMEIFGLEKVVQAAMERPRRDCVYLISAGVSAPLIIDRLYDLIPDSWFIDCGSIWDAFVGIGGQRTWRANLYANPVAHQKWKEKCLYGI